MVSHTAYKSAGISEEEVCTLRHRGRVFDSSNKDLKREKNKFRSRHTEKLKMTKKMSCACILFTLAILVAYAVALEEESSKQAAIVDGNNNDNDYYDDDDYDYSVQDKKGHKHKHKNKLFLFSGGLKSLAAFIAIKVKIILVVITVIGIIGFTLKVFGALKYAGYIGGGGHGGECSVIHEPAYGLGTGYSATPPPSIAHGEEYGTWGGNNDWSSTGGYARSLVENYIDTEFVSHALKNMDMAEMVFSTLNMNDDQCRRRLVCEIDAKARQLPLLSYAMDFFSHGFEKYRTSGEKKFKECAKLYSDCDDHKESRSSMRKKRSVDKVRHRNHTPT